MFQQTLGISEAVVSTALSKLKTSPTKSEDMRGKHFTRPLVVHNDLKNHVNEHISSFSVVESLVYKARFKKGIP
ncbi:Uncharacterized protein FWK35_00014856 [Aphis craccivora]|uniref:Uncharacterized protein n=1 Tax=Aphis craccivora TaxID=307492 RepID=A0A6G0YAC9_APHCR|nr:Uncharacterized protein FWK35_00014856 [Aphis craccivora]